MFSRKPGDAGPSEADAEITPEEQRAWELGLERLEEEKRAALKDPGPTWREWFFYDHAKWWVGLLFLIADVWIVGSWVSGGGVTGLGAVGLVASLAAATYLEMLLWGYLWRRPTEGTPRGRGRFRPSWRALREFGRWTPESARLRARGVPDDGSPTPQEFL